jgi:hypothetical protein
MIQLQICVRYTYTAFLALEHPVLTVEVNELCDTGIYTFICSKIVVRKDRSCCLLIACAAVFIVVMWSVKYSNHLVLSYLFVQLFVYWVYSCYKMP